MKNASGGVGSGSLRVSAFRERFTHIDPQRYPELAGFNRDQIYEGKMGPGGLYLACRMIRAVTPRRESMRVMDLGCGRGATSVFFANQLGANVISVDLWIDAGERQALIARHHAEGRVVPL